MANNILIFGDLHLHSHKKSTDRLNDCIKVLEWVFNSAIENHIEDVIFLGDMFHDRTKIEVLTLYRVFEVFERYFGTHQPPFQLHLLLGNHDMWHRDKWDVHSPIILKAFEGVNVIDKPCTLNIQNHYIDFLPFTENPIVDLANLQTFVPRKPNEKRLLCSHLAIDGAKLNAFTEADIVVEHDGEMIRIDPEFLQGWSQTYLGHYHGEQALSHNIEYVGSPLELTFSESGQEKHIILHDLDTFDKKYLVNDFSPKHLILKPHQLSQDLSHHFVTVVVPDMSSTTTITEIKQDILQNHQVGSLDFRPEKKRNNDVDQKTILDAKAILETNDEMLKRYIAECSQEEKNGLVEELLFKVGCGLIHHESAQNELICYPLILKILEIIDEK